MVWRSVDNTLLTRVFDIFWQFRQKIQIVWHLLGKTKHCLPFKSAHKACSAKYPTQPLFNAVNTLEKIRLFGNAVKCANLNRNERKFQKHLGIVRNMCAKFYNHRINNAQVIRPSTVQAKKTLYFKICICPNGIQSRSLAVDNGMWYLIFEFFNSSF